jgi:hypothetical protein
MITGEHYKKLIHKAAYLLAIANNVRFYKNDIKIVFKTVLEGTAILGYTENFSGTRIILGTDGSYLLGSENILLDKNFSKQEQNFSISIKKLIEAYEQGIRTEYTNLGFINIFPNWWDTIILGTNNQENITVWQHGKPLSQPNLYLKFDKNNPQMFDNIISQIKNTNIWEYTIVDKTYTLDDIKNIIETYKTETINRFKQQDFIDDDYAANNIQKYIPHMLIIKEIYPMFDVKQYENEKELTSKMRTLNALSQLASNSDRSGISILLYTKHSKKASLPQNVRMHFSTINEIKNIVF